MRLLQVLDELGGVARRHELLEHVSRHDLDRALDHGLLVRLGRGTYGWSRAPLEAAAVEAAGVLSHASAAEWHGWDLKQRPDRPVVTVPRHRNVPAALRERVDFRYADLRPPAVAGVVTSAVATVIACARTLPYDEALCVADSALRCGHVTADALRTAARSSPRTGRARAQRVVSAADGRSANAFESVIRAISHDVPGLALVPQVPVATALTPDLVDVARRVVVECDSWTFHAEKAAFHRDLERYNALVLDGWLVLRFDRGHAMEDPAYVRRCLEQAVAGRS